MKFLSKTKKVALKGKTVIVRIDLNVEPGRKLDSYRLKAVIPTIHFLRTRGARVVLMSHRGYPNLKPKNRLKSLATDWNFDKKNKELSLKPFVKVLSRKLKESVFFVPYEKSWLIDKKRFLAKQRESVFLFENLRFYWGEKTNDMRFAEFLAGWGDIYVNDAFPESHRKVASIAGVPKYLPSYAGFVLEREIENLGRVMKNPRRPVTLIMGGAKIVDKIDVIEYLWKKTDAVLLGGGPANTFFAAEGLPMGDSLVDVSAFPFIREYRDKGKIMLPVDSERFVRADSERILDIGEVTMCWFADIIKNSETVIWNGPMGLFEKKGFEKGTIAIWKAIFALAKKNPKARIVVGGGETVASLRLLKTKNYKLKTKNLFISTGGGAMLDFLSGKKLPGIVALSKTGKR